MNRCVEYDRVVVHSEEIASRLQWLPGRFAICRLDSRATSMTEAGEMVDRLISGGLSGGRAGYEQNVAADTLISITRTVDEVSIVLPQQHIADAKLAMPHMKVESDWAALRVAGALEFSLTGIIASLSAALADAAVPVFVLSTFDTDYLLVKESDIQRAAAALGIRSPANKRE